MSRKILSFTAFSVMAASQAFAVVKTELFLDAGGGNTATIDVDALGVVSCSGTCGGLVLPASISPHTTLGVTGTLAQFTINTTGVGGLDAIAPTLQNLNQVQAASTGAGTLRASFTDTDFCLGGGGCFGSSFVLAASTVNDTAIGASTTDFSAFVSGTNAVPASSLIGSFLGLTGLADAEASTFVNPIGSSGSLTAATVISFTGTGRVQANFQISTINTVPEPASVVLFGVVAAFAVFRVRSKVRTS